jgi:formylglycine-generating enzyme required for sulfatase activity
MIPLLLLFAVSVQAGEWRNPKDGMIFVPVPAGDVKLPCLKGPECPETGKRRFVFESFWVARTETTVDQFRRFTADTGYRTLAERENARYTWKDPGFEQAGDHPAVYIAYEDAVAYAEWAGVELPDEAEWEYASRAGAATSLAFGEQTAEAFVWHRGNSPEGTHAAGSKQPNPWGLYDMIGNAWEWCRIAAPEGQKCGHGTPRGGSWTRCLEYRFRDGRMVDSLAASVGPLTSVCAKQKVLEYDDDRGFRCVRRLRK